MKKLLIVSLLVAPLFGCHASVGVPARTTTTYSTAAPATTTTYTTAAAPVTTSRTTVTRTSY